MLLTNHYHDAIIKILVRYHNLSVQDLHAELKKAQLKVSLPNLYRVVQTLIDQYVLIKKLGKLQLHHSWIMELQQLSQQLVSRSSWNIDDVLGLIDWEKLVVKATSLIELETQRVDIVMSLNLHYPVNDWFFWYNEHSYFTLGLTDIESDANQKLATNNVPIFGILGSDTPLDIRAKNKQLENKDWTRSIIIYPESIFEKTSWYCLNIYGDRIFEVILPAQVTNLFNIYFDNIQSYKKLDLNWYKSLFSLKDSFKLTIRRDAGQAKKLKSFFKKQQQKNSP